MPLWMCSCPASALNSSIRAFTSCRVTRSRAAIDSRSTWSTHPLVVLDHAVRHRRPRAPSAPSAPPATAAARARSCAPATTAAPSTYWRNARRERWGSGAYSSWARPHSPRPVRKDRSVRQNGRRLPAAEACGAADKAASADYLLSFGPSDGDLAAGGLEGDVGAVLGALDPDLADRGVRAPPASSRSLPVALTASTRPPAVTSSSSSSAVPAWKTRTASTSACSMPRDRVALARAGRVLLRGDHDRDRGGVPPAQRPVVGQLAGRGGVQEATERGLQQRQQRLRLRVAEAAVELDHPDTARRQRETGVQQAAERRTAVAQLVDGRLEHVLGDLRRPGSSGAQGNGV